MSFHSRLSSVSSIDDLDFERVASPEAESFDESESPLREESPVLVDAREVEEEVQEERNAHLHAMIADLQQRLDTQTNLYQESQLENQIMRRELTSSGLLVTKLTQQLEEEKRKQWELEEERCRMRQVAAENYKLKEAVEKLEKLSLQDRIKAEPGSSAPSSGPLPAFDFLGAQPQSSGALPSLQSWAFGSPVQTTQALESWEVAYLQQQQQLKTLGSSEVKPTVYQQLADKDVEIANLKAEIEQRNQAKTVRRAVKEERKKVRQATYQPYQVPNYGDSYGGAYKSQKQLTEELQLADQQIGIIVEHNDYLRTVEANEHSQELCRLRAENEQLNQTICFLKQQLV